MSVPDMSLYTQLLALLNSFLGSLHSASLQSVTDLLWALLLSQSLHPADLSRALPNLKTANSRQAFRRVRRIISRSCLSSTYLTPWLIKAVLRLVPDKELMLILDSTRCLRWEIFTLSIRIGGRALPIAWSILPYPWPKGRYSPTVVQLLKRTLKEWPNDRPVHFLADRGFPSLKLFGELEHWQKRLPLNSTVRLRAGDWVRMADGRSVKLAQLMSEVKEGQWRTYQASYQQRSKYSKPSLLVVGKGAPVYPAHQTGPADVARRKQRAERKKARLLSKGQPNSPQTDTIWALLSTAGNRKQAVKHYSFRFSIEGMYRDVKSWGLEAVAAQEMDSGHLDGLMGLASIGYFVQAAIGMEAGRARQKAVRARKKQWSTTGRLSVFWLGRQVLHDHGCDWRVWLSATLTKLTQQMRPNKVIHTNQIHELVPSVKQRKAHPKQGCREAA